MRAPISGIATDLWNARNRWLEANVAVLDWFTSQQPPPRIVNGNFSGLTQAQYADSGWRQLPWPVDDNYLGRLRSEAGPVREAGLT